VDVLGTLLEPAVAVREAVEIGERGQVGRIEPIRPRTPWAATVWTGMPECAAKGVRTTPIGVNVTGPDTANPRARRSPSWP
jgi:hypothetical protein